MKLRLQIGLLGIVLALIAVSGCSQDGSAPNVTGSSLSSADNLATGVGGGDATTGRGCGGGGGGGGNGGGGNGGGGYGGGGGGNGGGGHGGGGGGNGGGGYGDGDGGDDGDGGCGPGNSTAFGYSCEAATCFLQLDLDGCNGPDFHRWGWTNGPISQGHYIYDLYAGAGQCDLAKGTLVGQVRVSYEGSTVEVTYDLCGPYGLAAAHVYVGSNVLPKKPNGRYTVAPGRYPYKAENLGGVQDHVATFQSVTGPVYVIAHAEVTGDLAQGDCGERGCVSPCDEGFHPEVLDAALPTNFVTMRLRAQGNNPLYGINDAYFQGGLSNAGIFSSPSGVFDHPTWCVDIDHDINSVTDSLRMVSSYSLDAALLACLVEHPENLDAVNWLINQDPAQWGADQRDIQAALWALLEDNFTFCAGATCNFGGITYDKARVQAIVADALALGEGFVPPCDGVVGILLDPGCTIGVAVHDQVCIMEFPVGLVPDLCTVCPPGE